MLLCSQLTFHILLARLTSNWICLELNISVFHTGISWLTGVPVVCCSPFDTHELALNLLDLSWRSLIYFSVAWLASSNGSLFCEWRFCIWCFLRLFGCFRSTSWKEIPKIWLKTFSTHHSALCETSCPKSCGSKSVQKKGKHTCNALINVTCICSSF